MLENKDSADLEAGRGRMDQNCAEVRPVSMLSFTMQVPWTSTASQGMIIPLDGMTMRSPGTSSVDMACSISSNNMGSEY